MNNFPTMLAVSRQYMFELKWQNTFTTFSSAVELTATRFQGRPTSGKSNVVDYFPREIRKLPNLEESTLGKIARKERGIFVDFVFCIFEEVNFLCTAKCSILNENNGCSSMI